jgi:hypothetical protein
VSAGGCLRAGRVSAHSAGHTRARRRTTLGKLALQELRHRLGVLPAADVALDDLAEVREPAVERREVRLRVHGRLVHVVEDLLRAPSASVRAPRARRGRSGGAGEPRARPPPCAPAGARDGRRLTRMDAIWLYVAGPSRVRPMVRKKRERSEKTSESAASTRLLYVWLSFRTSFRRVTASAHARVKRERARDARAGRTLLDDGLVLLVDIGSLDVLSAVALERGEPVANTGSSLV